MSRSRPTVLVVEDLEYNRDRLKAALGDDFDVELAETAAAGLVAAESRPPDVVLLDLSLPDLDAHEAARQLRAQARGESIVLIAVTAHAMTGDRERALDAGCDDFLIKPVDGEVLRTRIGEWLARRR